MPGSRLVAGKAPDLNRILQSSRGTICGISPMKVLECSLLNWRHELLLFIFSTPMPEKIPLRGNGGRVGDPGLALYGDHWPGRGGPSGSHFRAYGDGMRYPPNC